MSHFFQGRLNFQGETGLGLGLRYYYPAADPSGAHFSDPELSLKSGPGLCGFVWL